MSKNFKRFFCLVLVLAMVLPVLAGCGKEEQTPEEPTVTPTEPAEEAGVLKILTLGHSLTVDACHMLNMVAAAEGMENLVIGTLYYSGCPLYKHVQFSANDEAVYNLYLSSTATPNAIPDIQENVTMKYALTFDYWDIIIMQGGGFEVSECETYTNGDIQTLQAYVNKYKPDWATFGWHMPWVFPVDPDLQQTQSTGTVHKHYEKFGHDRSKLFSAVTKCVSDYIVPDDSFSLLIPSGTALENALSSYLTEKDIHRDYGHASDFGRLIAAYIWYCKLAGIEQLDAIKLEKVPKQFFKSIPAGMPDWVLTDHEKEMILESVNNALKNPLQVTQSKFTEKPAQ
jgi:hypothetical protein